MYIVIYQTSHEAMWWEEKYGSLCHCVWEFLACLGPLWAVLRPFGGFLGLLLTHLGYCILNLVNIRHLKVILGSFVCLWLFLAQIWAFFLGGGGLLQDWFVTYLVLSQDLDGKFDIHLGQSALFHWSRWQIQGLQDRFWSVIVILSDWWAHLHFSLLVTVQTFVWRKGGKP